MHPHGFAHLSLYLHYTKTGVQHLLWCLSVIPPRAGFPPDGDGHTVPFQFRGLIPFRWNEYHNERLAMSAAVLLRRITGDRCDVRRRGALYEIVRIDPTGKEVEQE